MTTLISLTGLTLSNASPVENAPVSATAAPAEASCAYQWSRCATSDGAFENISGATNASYTPTSGDVGNFLRCTATGSGAHTGTTSATTENAVIYSTPVLEVEASGTTDVTITFTAAADRIYTLEYTSATIDDAPDWTNPTTNGSPVSGSAITGLVAGTTYYFRLKSGDGNNISSAWSETVSATPGVVVLTPPTDLTANAFSKNKIIVTFTPSPNASSHTVEYGTAADFSNAVTTANFSSGSAVFASAAETRVYIRLWAVGDNVAYADSSKVTVDTLSAPEHRFIVLNSRYAGEGSLRQAIADASANDVDTITFAPSLSGAFVPLNSSLTTDKSLVIDASSLTNKITLSGNGDRCLLWSGTGTLEIKNVIFRDGFSNDMKFYFYSGEQYMFIGAGICAPNGGALTMYRCEIRDNNAALDYSEFGGGIAAAGPLTLDECQIVGNTAAKGGGVFVIGPGNFTNCTFSDNGVEQTSTVSGSMDFSYLCRGGGIYSVAHLVLTDCLVHNNGFTYVITANTDGDIDITAAAGGLYAEGGVTANRCAFTGNIAAVTVSRGEYSTGSISYSSACGGIFTGNASTFANCLIAGNRSDKLAAISSSDLSNNVNTVFSNCTLVGNIAGRLEKTIRIGNTDANRTYFQNCIIQGNSSDAIAAYLLSYDGNSQTTSTLRLSAFNTLSVFTEWNSATSANNVEYNATLPLFADPANGDYSLAVNSQALDIGNNSYVDSETDLAGNARIQNETVDVGCYEFVVVPPTALEAPGGLSAQIVSASEIRLNWNAVENASGYLIRYAADAETPEYHYASFGPAAVTGTVAGLEYDTTYSFWIQSRGTGAFVNSDWSAPVEQTTPEYSTYVAPVVTLLGDSHVLVPLGSYYIDPGATAVDWQNNPLAVSVAGSVTTQIAGTYPIVYSAVDSLNLTGSAVRTVVVVAPESLGPVEPLWKITLAAF